MANKQETPGNYSSTTLNILVAKGAVLECGGERVEVPGACQGGWFLSPAVLTNCKDDMR